VDFLLHDFGRTAKFCAVKSHVGVTLAQFLRLVMAGLVPAIHVFALVDALKTWMPGTGPGMTACVSEAAAHDS